MRLTLLIFLGLLISVGVIAQAPNISSFSPSSGPVGTLVTINGTNLNSPTSFSIGGATAIVISNTGTQLVGLVMPGAVTGNVSLTTAGGAGSAAGAFSVVATSYPAIQQGSKLLGTNNIRAGLGYSVALSADGNTAVLGGFTDNSNQGAVWVYVRSGGIWTQQGSKLVGTGSAAQAEQGTSVAISADGNTVVVGGYMDTPPGGAWVFSRSGTTWTQQAKLIGTGYTGAGASQGASVSISADGNTAIVGGPGDNSNQGAVWVFTRSNSVWSQKGNKLVGAGNSGAAFQGNAVAISGDGNTICAAGYVDNSSQGAVWIYTLNAGSWTQQGSKLVGTGNVGAANQGVSVALSADGNTALVGGYIDNNHLGAAWVFSRSGTIWAQQGNKLVGAGSSGSIVQQGFSVSLSADGNIAIVGGHYDNNNQGSVWVYSRAGISWTQQGNKLVGTGGTATALQGESVAVSADGNTLVVGGTGDNVNTGAAWAFTDALSPIVTTQPATAVTATGATLNGIVNDNGSITTVSIEYGTASNLAGSTIATLSSGVSPIASGTGNVSFTSVLTGLIPNTNYYFRINGVNGSGTANGAILSFTTQSGTPTITSFSPSSSLPGSTITITGTNLLGVTSVSIGGVPATSYTIVSTTIIAAVVGAGATSGNVTVTGSVGAVSLPGFVLLTAPNIYYQTPQNYPTGAAITPLLPVNTGGAVPATIYGQVSTFAGSGAQGSNNGTGTAASFKFPVALAADASGNVYVGDAGNQLIRKITPAGLVSTLAGSGSIGSNNGLGSSASFWEPDGLALDALGNVYVADGSNNLIRKITPGGLVSTFAGSGVQGLANGTGTSAAFNNPWGITIDAAGNIFVVDNGNNQIRKITPAGIVTTFAGNGIYGSLNGLGTAATFNYPTGMAIDGFGNLYVADSQNNLIRKVNPSALTSTFEDGSVSGGNLSRPYGATTDIAGNVYIADYSTNKILKLSSGGILTLLAGSGTQGSLDGIGAGASFYHPFGLTSDISGNIYVADQLNNVIRKINATGYTISPALPTGLVFDPTTGKISGTPTTVAAATTYTVTAYNTAGSSSSTFTIAVTGPQPPAITSFSPSSSAPGSTITITGTNLLGITSVGIGGVPATSYTIVSATTITAVVGATATSGNVSITWSGGSVSSPGFVLLTAPNISYQTPQNYATGVAITPLVPVNTGGAVSITGAYGQVSTLAGTGTIGTNNGAGNVASFYAPSGATIDASGNIYVADWLNSLVRKITPVGLVSTLAGNIVAGNLNGTGTTASFNNPTDVAIDNLTGNIYVADYNNQVIRKITPAGVVSTFAGNGSQTSMDGNGTNASFNYPSGIVVDGSGNLFVTDKAGAVIRKITPAGVVTTIAGSGFQAFNDGTGSAASFYHPTSIAIDANNNLFVADYLNNRIRKITPSGVVSTLAGSGTTGRADGTGTSASFYGPTGLCVDGSGNIYVADYNNNLIRKVTQAGVVTTIAGNGSQGSNNGIGIASSFSYPYDVVCDASGNLFVTDQLNNQIRKITLATGYTIDKTLPTGLSFSPTTGIISGTPTVASPATVYTITGYNAAGSSVTTVTIAVASPQTITFTGGNSTTITKSYGDPDFLPNATASSGLPVTYTSSNPAVATVTAGGNIHVVGVGTTVITATQPGNSTYLPAASVTQTITVLPVPLSISAPVSASRVFGAPNPVFTITYTGFVNGETSANLTTQPTISTNATVTSLPGTYPITVMGAVDPNYTITYVPGVLTVTTAQRTLTFGPISNQTYGAPDFDPGATVDSGDPITYTSSNPAVAIIVNGKIHIVGAGTDTITATVPNKPGYVNVAPVSQKLIINRAMQIITFAPIATQTMGSPDIMLIVTSDSGLPVTLSSSDPTIAVINGSMLKITGVGTATITATQPGNANYLPATATQTITIITMGTITAASNIVPNAFTPNGDGVNDNWDIPFLINYPNCIVKVFSRRGQMVFSSVGYPTPWDGKYNGTVLPVGAYYYIIDTKDVLGILSGTVNLVK